MWLLCCFWAQHCLRRSTRDKAAGLQVYTGRTAGTACRAVGAGAAGSSRRAGRQQDSRSPDAQEISRARMISQFRTSGGPAHVVRSPATLPESAVSSSSRASCIGVQLTATRCKVSGQKHHSTQGRTKHLDEDETQEAAGAKSLCPKASVNALKALLQLCCLAAESLQQRSGLLHQCSAWRQSSSETSPTVAAELSLASKQQQARPAPLVQR